QGTEFGEQGDRFGDAALGDVGLDGGVVQLGAAADRGAFHLYVGGPAVGVDVDGPDDGCAYLVGQQAHRALGEDGRVQGYIAVRQVHRLPARPGLPFQRAARAYVRGDVGDGVVDPVPAAGPAFQVHRLVQIHRPRWIDGDERKAGAVQRGQRGRGGHRPVRLSLGRGREPLRQFQLAAQGTEVDA